MISPALTIGFLGTGHMAQSFIKGLVESAVIRPQQIWVSNRSERKAVKISEVFHVQHAQSNEDLCDKSHIIFVCVKPQDLREALEPLASVLHQDHLVVSLAAGVSLRELRKVLPHGNLVRVIANTALSVKKSVIGISYEEKRSPLELSLRTLLDCLGEIIEVEDTEMMSALTVATSSGTAFVFELMEYFKDWLEEYGFSEDQAQLMTTQTFLGASLLASQNSNRSFSELQDQVASKKGMTATGLLSIRENEVERGLRIAFEKTVMKERQLGKILDES